MDISLLYIDPATKLVSLKLSSKSVKGIQKLLQIVVLSLLNIPGKDILDPVSGGGIPDLIGTNFGEDDFTEIVGEVTSRVRKTESEILSGQIGLNVPPDERLTAVEIVNMQPGGSPSSILTRLRVVNSLGQQADVVM